METQLWQPNRTEPNRTEIIHDLENNFTKNKILQLKTLFPEAFCENQIDWEKLKLILGADNLAHQNERYQLNWAGKTDAYRTLQAPTFNTLSPCRAESVDFDGTRNLFIEAENLEALKILQKAYAGSVKMIYIDPPYNTGSDSFIYPDKFSETREEYARRVGDKDADGYLKRDGVFQGAWRKNSKDSGHYHSNWLSMMLPRLHLARTLLRDDGVIFISIDDNEQAQLKLLCDEVFGAENFVAELVWQKGRKSTGKTIAINHEYCFIYAKHLSIILEQVDNGLSYWKRRKEGIDDLYGYENALRTKYKEDLHLINKEYKKLLSKLEESDAAFAHKHYKCIDEKGIYFPADASAPDKPETRCHRPLIHPITQKPCAIPRLGWRYNESKLLEMYEKGLFHFGSDETTIPCVKRYLKNTEFEVSQSIFYKDGRGASTRLNTLMGKKVFNFPKDETVIQDFIKFVAFNSDSLILDFFAGSGTTAHAVMQLNAEDDGNRRYICVQLPEEIDLNDTDNKEVNKAAYDLCQSLGVPPTIAEIAKERIRRAGVAISGSLKEGQSVDTGFKVFKLSESSFKQWRQPEDGADLEQQLSLAIDSVAEHATPENMVYELMLRLGCKLTSPVEHKNGVYWVTDEDTGKRIALLLEAADQTLIDEVIAAAPAKVVALDKWFDGNDALKSNTVLQMKDAGIVFECV